MPYTVSSDDTQGYILIRINGPFSFEDYRRLAREVAREVPKSKQHRVLVDDSQVQHISTTTNVSLFPAMLKEVGLSSTGRVAIVTGEDQLTRADVDLFAIICREAGLQVRPFEGLTDARNWLLHEHDD